MYRAVNTDEFMAHRRLFRERVAGVGPMPPRAVASTGFEPFTAQEESAIMRLFPGYLRFEYPGTSLDMPYDLGWWQSARPSSPADNKYVYPIEFILAFVLTPSGRMHHEYRTVFMTRDVDEWIWVTVCCFIERVPPLVAVGRVATYDTIRRVLNRDTLRHMAHFKCDQVSGLRQLVESGRLGRYPWPE